MKSVISDMKKIIIAVILLGFIGFGVYCNSLNGPLFWDDEVTVINNVFIRHPAEYIAEIFSTSYHTGGGETLNFYRPLATLSFAADYKVWKLNPFGYHLSNVILHVLNGVFIFVILLSLFKKYFLSLIPAGLFLIHPINSEAVNYVSNRTDLLMVFFFLSAFYAYVIYRRKGKTFFLILSLVFYAFSFLSKEIGAVLILFVAGYEWIFFKKSRKSKSVIIFAVLFTAYALLRTCVLNFPAPEAYSHNIGFRFLIFGQTLLTYLKLFFLPVNLHMEYDMPILEPHLALAGALLFISMILLIKYRAFEMPVIFGLFWFTGGLLPVSGIIVPINNVVSEHYLYLSSIGVFIVSAALCGALWNASPHFIKVFLLVCAIFITGGFGYLTFQRNKAWQDPLTMYLDIAANTKYSFRANNNAGVEYFRQGDINAAEKYFRRSLKIFPRYAEALNNLGVVFQRRGYITEAEKLYKSSVDSNPSYVLARKNLAGIYMASGRRQKAEDELSKALKIYPYDTGN